MPARRQPDGAVVEETLAVERPLQISVNGQDFAVVMRTPGRDRCLIVGLLLGDGIMTAAGVGLLCLDVRHGENGCDAATVTVPEPYVCPNLAAHRSLTSGSACGICGQRRWQPPELPPLASGCIPNLTVQSRLLRQAQEVFSLTGGSHAAAIFSVNDRLLAFAEDVGRHNAVDKVVGQLVLADAPDSEQPNCLLVSGRLAYELVLKAWRAGIPVIAGVSAPTSAAVELARQANIRLYGFCRDERATCYAGEDFDRA